MRLALVLPFYCLLFVCFAMPAAVVHTTELKTNQPPLRYQSLRRFGFDHQLTGQTTGWQFLGQGYRAYNPLLHRFLSSDSASPFGQGGVNRYIFGHNNPIGYFDPSGHMPMVLKEFTIGLLWSLSAFPGIWMSCRSFHLGSPLLSPGFIMSGSSEALSFASVVISGAAYIYKSKVLQQVGLYTGVASLGLGFSSMLVHLNIPNPILSLFNNQAELDEYELVRQLQILDSDRVSVRAQLARGRSINQLKTSRLIRITMRLNRHQYAQINAYRNSLVQYAESLPMEVRQHLRSLYQWDRWVRRVVGHTERSDLGFVDRYFVEHYEARIQSSQDYFARTLSNRLTIAQEKAFAETTGISWTEFIHSLHVRDILTVPISTVSRLALF